MSFPDETLYARNDDEMEDYGDIGAYDDSMEEEYEEEEEEEMDEPSALTPRGGAMSIVPAMPSRTGAPPPRKPAPKKAKKKAAKKKAAKKGGKKKAGKKKGRRR